MTKQNDPDQAGAILALHRYFRWASILQKRFREEGGRLDEAISEERASAGVDLRRAPADLTRLSQLEAKMRYFLGKIGRRGA